MASVTNDDILKLARLSRLDIEPDEIESFAAEIAAILGYVEQLQAVDVGDRQPTYQVTGLKNVTRPDVVKDYGMKAQELLKNAPAIEKDQLRVRRMIG